VAIVATIALAGCVSSNEPILGDAKPILGERGSLHMFGLYNGSASAPTVSEFKWNGSRYVVTGGSNEATDFTIHPFDGRDFIVQGLSSRRRGAIDYALARRLADGTYLLRAIDEDDADEATRKALCKRDDRGPCHIATREALFTLAKATAAKLGESGGLAVVVPARD
jgi:hypothetical protein